jgi:hypothetical protein
LLLVCTLKIKVLNQMHFRTGGLLKKVFHFEKMTEILSVFENNIPAPSPILKNEFAIFLGSIGEIETFFDLI